MGAPASRPALPAPVASLPAALCRRLTHFFTDIDDTLTANGMIPAGSFAALWELSSSGIQVVPVTGRPAGWCDHIARMWPVAGVVGENGAFSYVYDRKGKTMARHLSDPGLADPGRHRALEAVARRVLREVPGTGLAADQAFRLSDIAIDYCEDVPPLPPERLDRVCAILREEGVQFKVSSIHVNFWLGSFDKMTGVRRFLQEQGLAWEAVNDCTVFIGDSPNDEPLFAGFAHSIAVGSLRKYLDRLENLPEFITESGPAEGFQEAAAEILRKRRP
jgi:HAD superfamily hydrolase (TIGR01484 family)